MRSSPRSAAGAIRFAAAALIVLAASAADARLCGDDVGGQDVPCRCGDIVVSDVALAGDPVTRERCAGDALLVRASRGLAQLHIDLTGATLRGGRRGVGIRILDGGASGAVVFASGSPGRIEGFRDGLVSQARRLGLAELHGLHVHGAARDGVRLYGDGRLVREVEVTNAGRDGIFLRGDGWTLEGVVARQNGRHGVSLMGSEVLARAPAGGISLRAEGNGADGIRFWGDGNLLFDCAASGTRASGIALNGLEFDVRGCEATANAGGGLVRSTSRARFSGIQASGNFDEGIAVHGHEVFDAGANAGSGNAPSDESAQAIQCRLGLEPCL